MKKIGITIGTLAIIIALLYFIYSIYNYEDREELLNERNVNQKINNVVNTNIEGYESKI